jgi:hypothetical protein
MSAPLVIIITIPDSGSSTITLIFFLSLVKSILYMNLNTFYYPLISTTISSELLSINLYPTFFAILINVTSSGDYP